jgi:predicted phosphodiesterase
MTSVPSILFFGDPHGLSASVVKGTLKIGPKAIVLLGDLELEQPLDDEYREVLDAGVKVYWIHGNHDIEGGPVTWSDLTNGTWNPRTARGALHGRVLEIAGLRVAGLGGIFREGVWLPPAAPRVGSFGALQREYQRSIPQNWMIRAAGMRDTIFPNDVDRLAKLRADILVSHEAPSSHSHGFAAIDELAATMGARMVVHGHHHDAYLAEHVESGLRVAGTGMAAAVDEEGREVVPSQSPARPPRLSESGRWRVVDQSSLTEVRI